MAHWIEVICAAKQESEKAKALRGSKFVPCPDCEKAYNHLLGQLRGTASALAVKNHSGENFDTSLRRDNADLCAYIIELGGNLYEASGAADRKLTGSH